MSGETEASVSGWTIDTLRYHHDTVRAMQREFDEERDRRYSEVATEREKALKIKETADLAALGLARDIQIYKDEKANELRSQIERERGTYASKDDLLAAMDKFEALLKAKALDIRTVLFAVLGVLLTAALVVVAIITLASR
jgi:hypothetical protein